MLHKHSQRTVRRGCNVCGRTNLYWAHDTDIVGEFCDRCMVSGSWVLIEENGERHVHSNDKNKGPITEYPWNSPKSDPLGDIKDVFSIDSGNSTKAYRWADGETLPKEVKFAKTSENEVEAAFRTLISAMGPNLDREEIREMIKEEFNAIVFPTRTVTIHDDGVRHEVSGKTHNKLADVLTDLSAGEHVLMVGPAGTGKSTIAEQCAEALGFKFYSISLSPMTASSQILGYMQAEGEYVRSLFREAYENGGVFHFDEFDNGHPSILATVNAALANGQMAFPDKMVKRHEDFRCVASANTYGRGPDRQYVGRQQLDAATLDRFAVETIEIDEALENDLCHSTGLETAKVQRVLTYVRALRTSAERQQMAVIISPRASVGMCRLMKAGRSAKDAIDARIRRGLSDQDWAKLTDTVPRF